MEIIKSYPMTDKEVEAAAAKKELRDFLAADDTRTDDELDQMIDGPPKMDDESFI